MNLLVTGGAGFIGSNFIIYWLKNHPQDYIYNLDLMTYCANPLTVKYHQESFGAHYEFVKGDICDEDLVDDLVKKVDLVVHFAAESHVDRSINSPHDFVRTNVLGTHVLLAAAKKHGNKRFHHISTDEVFGTLELNSDLKFSEKSNLAPRSPYSASKAGADHLVYSYFATYGLPVTITNCSNNYGPFIFPEKVIPLYITRALENKPIPIYGTGKAIRDYLYVEDHCAAIEAVITKGRLGERYCIGGDAEKNTVEVAHTILDALDKPHSLIQYTADRPGHDLRYANNHSKITDELGWYPKYSFAEGVKLTIEWFRQNQSWWKPVLGKAEIIAEKYLSQPTSNQPA